MTAETVVPVTVSRTALSAGAQTPDGDTAVPERTATNAMGSAFPYLKLEPAVPVSSHSMSCTSAVGLSVSVLIVLLVLRV